MKHLKYKLLILTAMAIAALLVQPTNANPVAASLLLQQTPVQGGMVKPGIGLHQFELNTEVTLSAVPKPGYQFVYWLGDVIDPTASITVTYLNGPKIIIAVFERVANEFLVTEEQATSVPAQGLRRSPADYARGGGSGIGGKRPHHYYGPSQPEPEEEDKDFPVPEPIPEPATIILLAAGSLLAKKHRKFKNGKNA